MSFASLSGPAVLAGAFVLAGVLYLLQRLRSRRRIVRLPAAMLWSQAREGAPLRVLGSRFRYWLAYLLALAIVLSLWLAAAHPTLPAVSGGRAQRWFYLDSSAVLSGSGELTRAERALLADVRATPAASRAVFLGDTGGTRLLAPGESVSLLSARLDAVAAGARPSTFADWLRDRAGELRPGAVVRYYGAWPAARDATAGLSALPLLTWGYLAAPVPGNRGIVALGVTPAASGRPDAADVQIGLMGVSDPAAVRITHDGRSLAMTPVVSGGGRMLLRDVPADGALLAVALRRGDGFPADDTAAIRLPDRRPITVALSADVPRALWDAVRADDGLTVTDPAQARVIVRRSNAAARPGVPALVLAPVERGGAAFAFAGPDANAGNLRARVAAFGLGDLDAAAIADRFGRPVGVSVIDARTRTVTAWAELFDPAGPFARSPAAPAFVSRSLRWLAGDRPWTAYAAAGQPLPDGGETLAPRADGGLPGIAPVPADAGELTVAGRPLAVSLTDPATSAMIADPAPLPARSAGGGVAALPDAPFMALVAVAIVLLMGEWALLRRGWMP
jgi:hypothetical protein